METMDSEAITVQQELPSGNLGFVHLLAGAALVVVLLLTGWAYLQKHNLNNELVTVEANMAQVQAQLDKMTEQKLDSTVVAQNTIKQVKDTEIIWSEVLTRLLDATPVNVFYRSYTASMDGKLAVSVLTDSYDTAAQLISVLDQEDAFENVFVSSLSKGSASTGFDVVSFGVTFSVANNSK